MRERRLRLDLTQEAAADLAGVSRVAWNAMETGKRGIGPLNADRIARVLGGDPAEYLTRPAPRDELAQLRHRLEKVEHELERLRGEHAC